RRFSAGKCVLRQMRRCQQINDKCCCHAKSGGCKSVMPAELFAERPANEWCEKRAKIDTHVKYRECAIPAAVTRCIELANVRGDIGLEGSVAENEKPECEKEKLLECHREMSGSHQRGADDDGPALAQHAVGKQAAQDRRQVDQAGIETVDVRGKRLRGQRPENAFERGPESREPYDMARS